MILGWIADKWSPIPSRRGGGATWTTQNGTLLFRWSKHYFYPFIQFLCSSIYCSWHWDFCLILGLCGWKVLFFLKINQLKCVNFGFLLLRFFAKISIVGFILAPFTTFLGGLYWQKTVPNGPWPQNAMCQLLGTSLYSFQAKLKLLLKKSQLER